MQANYRFRFSDEHLLQTMLRWRQQDAWRRWITIFRLLLVIPVLVIALVAALANSTWIIALCVAVIFTLLFGWRIEKWILRRRFRKSPFRNEDLVLTFSEEGMQAHGPNQDSRVTWATYTKARRFSDGLLLFQGPDVFTWLPDPAAADPMSAASLHQLARANVSDYREV